MEEKQRGIFEEILVGLIDRCNEIHTLNVSIFGMEGGDEMSPTVSICLLLIGIASLVFGGYAIRQSRTSWKNFRSSLMQAHLDAYQGWMFLTLVCAGIGVSLCTVFMVVLLGMT